MLTRCGLGVVCFLGFWCAVGWSSWAKPAPLHRIKVSSVKDLYAFFHNHAGALPLVSAHRGGPTQGFPENAMETFTHTLQQFFAVIECDIRETADGKLVMLHDNGLKRSTNGTGQVHLTTWKSLQKLRLKDPNGQVTPYRIPLLSQVLTWARGKTILFLDVKSRLERRQGKQALALEKHMFTRVVQAIQRAKAHAYVVVITYNLRQARLVYSLDRRLMQSVGIATLAQAREHLRWIPARNMLAFTGVPLFRYDPQVLSWLRQKGIMGGVGMFRLEALARTLAISTKAKAQMMTVLYQDYWQRGIHLFASDSMPWMAQVFRPLYQQARQPGSRYHAYYKKYMSKW